MGHIFCAIVGAGVLGLPNSMAWLGWVAGPICLIVFFAVSMWSSHLLARLYCVDGIEFARYHHAVQHILVGPCRGCLVSHCVHHAGAGVSCPLRHRRLCATAACVLQGRPGAIAISIFQLLNLVLSDIGAPHRPAVFAHTAYLHSSSRVPSRAAAYSITGAIAMQTVADLIGSPFRSEWKLVLIMGAFELVFSQASGC